MLKYKDSKFHILNTIRTMKIQNQNIEIKYEKNIYNNHFVLILSELCWW